MFLRCVAGGLGGDRFYVVLQWMSMVNGVLELCVAWRNNDNPLLSRKEEAVYKFKGFDSAECGDSMSALEAMVNAWMEGEHPRIRNVCQSMRGEHILLTFVYEDTKQLEQRV